MFSPFRKTVLGQAREMLDITRRKENREYLSLHELKLGTIIGKNIDSESPSQDTIQGYLIILIIKVVIGL